MSKIKKQIIVVGAGASGLGIGVVLKKMNLDFLILERKTVGHSFKLWTKETKFISPSFTGNFFQMPDLNAITPDSSPAYNLLTEHPSGKEYSAYLKQVASHFDLPVKENTDVMFVKKIKDKFLIKTTKGAVECDFLIWAGGEYQYPNMNVFEGANLCLHSSKIKAYKNIKEDDLIIIGAYESGMDAAIQLSKLGKKVTVLDAGDEINNVVSDSSYALSPYTRDRLKEGVKFIITSNSRVLSVSKKQDYYVIKTKNKTYRTKAKPIVATGFSSSLVLVKDLFDFENHVLLTNNDESTKTKNLFLVGPQVRHDSAIFCFIYKFRQRFAVVAEVIARRLKKNNSDEVKEVLKYYKDYNFYLKDLSCCGDSCAC